MRAQLISAVTGFVLLFVLIVSSVVAPDLRAATFSDDAPYVALGDSFAAGEGAADNAHPYLFGTDQHRPNEINHCHRSQVAYSEKLAEHLGVAVSFRACSGATAGDYWHPQARGRRVGQKSGQIRKIPDIDPQVHWLERIASTPTSVITLMFGGNDIGFGTVAAVCGVYGLSRKEKAILLAAGGVPGLAPITAAAQRGESCAQAVSHAETLLPRLTEAPGQYSSDNKNGDHSLINLLSDVRSKLPDPATRVLLVGYPRLFPENPPSQCSSGFLSHHIHRADMKGLNKLVDDLNRQVYAAAQRVSDVTYVDQTQTFVAHDFCQKSASSKARNQRYVNRFHLTGGKRHSGVNESFHPNIAGQQALANRMIACYDDPSVCGTPPAAQTPAAPDPNAPSREGITGTLTIVPDQDYLLALGSPYPIDRIAGASVGHLTGTADGVEVWNASVLPLPIPLAPTKANCLRLNWADPSVRGVGDVIPWAELPAGSQWCVQTVYSGLWVSLLTVRSPQTAGAITFDATTWSCAAAPFESSICGTYEYHS